MLIFAFLPEIVAFLLFILVSTQMPAVGPLLVVAQFGLVGLLFIIRPSAFLDTLTRWWPLLLTAILATVSAVWSSVPDVSARYGAQLIFTVFVGIHLARTMTPTRFVSVFMLSMFVFCILCILNGRQGPSADGWVLIGLTGSKNQLSYAAQLLLMASITVLLMNASMVLRWIAVLAMPLSAYLLIGSHAATGVVMAVLGAFALIVFWMAQRLTPGARVAALLAMVLVIAPLTALMPEAQQALDHFLYETLNKDPTLTGRTLLWARADELIAQKPVLGYGYQAIWMGDSSDTIGLKRLTGIEDGRAFHFHNTFRQVAVDTGLVGLAIYVLTLVVVALRGFAQLLIRPTPATSFFFAVFLLMVLRAFTDSILGPFAIYTILVYACCVYAFWRPENAAEQSAPFAWLNRARAARADARFAGAAPSAGQAPRA
jgi:exopolysaccharide production protein ExoQ